MPYRKTQSIPLKEVWKMNDLLRPPKFQDVVTVIKKVPANSPVAAAAFLPTAAGEELHKALKPILRICKLLGIVPFQSNSLRDAKKWKIARSILVTIITLTLLTNTSLSLWSLVKNYRNRNGKNANDFALAAMNPTFFVMGSILYFLFLFKSKSFEQIFAQWKIVSSELILAEKDVNLAKDVRNISIFVGFTSLVENILHYGRFVPYFGHIHNESDSVHTHHEHIYENSSSTSWLEDYYYKSDVTLNKYFSYNLGIILFVLLSNHVIFITWTLADVMIIVLSRALIFKFKGLVNQTNKLIVNNENSSRPINNEIHLDGFGCLFWVKPLKGETENSFWQRVRKEHLILCNLVDIFEQYLSSILFVSFSMNIFFLCMQLNEGLTPTTVGNTIHIIWTVWSFFNLVVKIFLVCWTGAEVNRNAHKIKECAQKYSSQVYNSELERLETMLANISIGLTGMGCFVLTREFLLVIVSVCFTFEIVLIQASSVSQSN